MCVRTWDFVSVSANLRLDFGTAVTSRHFLFIICMSLESRAPLLTLNILNTFNFSRQM